MRPPSQRAQRANRIATATVFFVLLSVPVLWFDRATPGLAHLDENRRPEPFPRMSIEWPQRIERWFSDRFGMRDALVHFGARLQMARTGTPFNQKVVIGADGWLFYDETYAAGRPHFAELRGRAPFSQAQLATLGGNLARVDADLRRCGVRFYFVVPPDKQTLYRDKLGLADADPAAPSREDQLLAHLQATHPEIAVLDLRASLTQARRADPEELYLRTDTHWNTLGAFVAYRQIFARLQGDGVLHDDSRTRRESYRIGREPYPGGDIAVNLLSLPDYFDDTRVVFQSVRPRRAQPVTPGGQGAQAAAGYRNEQADGGTLVLFHDSFAGELLPFLAEDFRQVVAVPSHRPDVGIVRAAHPQVVMLEAVERNLTLLLDEPLWSSSACR